MSAGIIIHFVQGLNAAVWIGGYQMYSNNSHYWLDGEPVDVDMPVWFDFDPRYNEDTHLILFICQQWIMADYDDPTDKLRVLCEILFDMNRGVIHQRIQYGDM